MAKVDGAKIFEQLRLKQRTLDSLNRDEMMAVKSYSTFARQKTFSTTQPLAATKEGQAQLKKQAASIPKAPKVEAPKRERTWGEELAEAFPKTWEVAKGVGEALMENPYTGSALTALGAGGASLVDVIAEQLDPTSKKTILDSLAKQKAGMEAAGAEYLKQKGALKDLSISELADLFKTTLGGAAQVSRPALDITKGIFAQKQLSTSEFEDYLRKRQGLPTVNLTPEQAMKNAATAISQYPNLYGSSANVLATILDPLNIPIVGAASKISKSISKKAPTPEAKPKAPTQQVAKPEQKTPKQPQAPTVDETELLGEGGLIPELERLYGVKRQTTKPIKYKGKPTATKILDDLTPRIVGEQVPAPKAAVVEEPKPTITAVPKVKSEVDIKKEVDAKGTVEIDLDAETAKIFSRNNPDYNVKLTLDKDGEPVYRITKKQPEITPAPTPESPIATKIGEDLAPKQPVAQPQPQPVKKSGRPKKQPEITTKIEEDLVPEKDFVLPKKLSGSKPRYSYGSKQFELDFDSDLDKALYIVSQKTPSRADADFIKALADHTGLPTDQLRSLGTKVRDIIKQTVKDAPPGKIKITNTGVWKPVKVKPPTVATKIEEDLAPKKAGRTKKKSEPKATGERTEAQPVATKIEEDLKPKAEEPVATEIEKDLAPKAETPATIGEELAPPSVKKGGRPKKQPDATAPKPPKKGRVPKSQPQPVKKEKTPKVKPSPPETPFVGNERFVASANVPPEISSILKGWIEMLGMDNRIYITTADEAAKHEFTKRPFLKTSLGEMTSGQARRFMHASTDAMIIYRPNKSITRNLELISHELGHILMTAKYQTAPAHIRKAIDDEYNRWYVSVKGGTAQNLINKLRSYMSIKANKVPADLMAKDMKSFESYWASKDEWFADQVAKWATTTDKPLTVVEKFFSKLARTLKQFFQKNKEYLPSQTMKEWLDSLQKTVAKSPNTRPLISSIKVDESQTVTKTTRKVEDETLTAKDKSVEDMLSATADRSFKFREKATEVLDNLQNMFLKFKPMGQISKFYRDKKGQSPANAIREAFYEGMRGIARASDTAERDMRAIFKTIKSKEDKELLTRFIVLRDALQTIRVDELTKLQEGVTKAKILKELKELAPKLRDNKNVIDAIKRYDSIMRNVYRTLVSKGVLKPDSRRIGYFPRQVIKYAGTIKYDPSLKLDTPARGYSLRREGSTDPYDTDFEEVVRRSLTKIYSDNAIQKTLNRVLPLADALTSIQYKDIEVNKGQNLLKQAQQASVETPDYKAWKAIKVKELMDQGMNQKQAVSEAWKIWKSDVPKSEKDLFMMRMFKEYRKDGITGRAAVQRINQRWLEHKDQPKLVMERVNEGTVITADNKTYRLFKPRFEEKIYLIPEEVYNEIKDFGEPIHKKDEWVYILGKVTGFFKTTALTLTAPARLVIDSLANMAKLAVMDTAALFELPRAVRIVLSSSDSPLANKLDYYLRKLTNAKSQILDTKVRQFMLEHEIIEPAELTKGVYQFTPMFEKVLRQMANVGGHSRTATQRLDEIFRAAKVSRDLRRVMAGESGNVSKFALKHFWNGGFAKADGIIDVEGLDKLGQVSKIGHEFTVNSMRQSRTMRRYFTQLWFPFLNWPAVDTLHAFRYVTNRPIKAGIQLGALVAAFEMWNNTGERRQVEELLPPEKRATPHLITGFTGKENKPIIFYFPIFPGLTFSQATGLANIPQNVTDAIVTSTIPGKEKKELTPSEIFENPIKPLAKTVSGMANPFFRTFGEQIFNKSLFTGRPIVKSSEEGTSAEITQRLKYALEQTAPPYRAYASSIKESEKAMVEDENAKRSETTAEALLKFFSPMKRIRKEEDIKKLAEAKSYSLVEKRRIEEKNPAYQQIRQLFPKALNSGDFSKIDEVMQKAGLSEREVKSFISSNYIAIIQDALKQATDPEKRKAYKKQLEGLQAKEAEERVNRAGSKNYQEAMRYYELQKEGVK